MAELGEGEKLGFCDLGIRGYDHSTLDMCPA